MENNLNSAKIYHFNKILKSKIYDDYYFNFKDPFNEALYVYVNGNFLNERMQDKNNFVIGELGFGSGLNFLVTFDFFLKKKINSSLHYIAFEGNPLEIIQLKKIYLNFPSLKKISNKLLKKMPFKVKGVHDIYFEEENVRLTLVYNTFDYLKNFSFFADAWYLDGFSPSKNPSAWETKIMKYVFRNTSYSGTFSTFTAASNVRKTLVYVGFEVFKKKGHLNKREMLYGSKYFSNKRINYNLHNFKIEPIAIIGGGISGASTSYSLSKRNLECFIVEKGSNLGSGASGNLLAFQLPKLTLDNSMYGKLSLRSFFYSRMLAQKLNATPKTNGILVFPNRYREIEKFRKLLKHKWPSNLFNNYTDDELIDYQVVHKFSTSGIVNTKSFLTNLSSQVKIINNFDVNKVIDKEQSKIIISNNGKILNARTIIWANGFENNNKDLSKINIPVSGQVTYLKENSSLNKDLMNYSYGNFFSQAHMGVHQIGATFSRNITHLNELNNQVNIDNIPLFLKMKLNNQFKIKGSRWSVRSSTKNRLPYFGTLDKINEYYIGGMGSWGFTYSPFLAELLVRKILNEPLTIEDYVLKILDIRNRVQNY